MATVTITTTSPQDARIAPAVGAFIGLSGSANATQVKQALIDFLTNIVLQYERKAAADSAAAAVSPITPT